MRVLIACEYSGTVRDAFIRRGHDAMSCDLLPTDVPGPHHQGVVRDILADGWDLMLGHPSCRYLSVSGMHWTTRGLRDPRLTDEAIAFAELLWDAPIPRICIENPVSVLSTRSRLAEPADVVQPYEFGDDASKKTCLWLRGLPPLKRDPSRRIAGRIVQWKGKTVERWSNQTDSGQNILGPSDDRWKKRAKTYRGIADAMAEQWGCL